MELHFEGKATAETDAKLKKRYQSQKSMSLYVPGDTRMLSVFKMIYRVVYLVGGRVSLEGIQIWCDFGQSLLVWS